MKDILFKDWNYKENFEEHPLIDILIDESNGAPILDIGCGNGKVIEIFNKVGIDIDGIDPCKEAILLCRGKGLKVKQSYIKDFKPKIKYKTIFMNDVICSLTNIKRDIKKVCGWLEEEGILIFNVGNKYSLRHIFKYGLNNYKGISIKETEKIIKKNGLIIKKKIGIGRLRFIKPISAGVVYITRKI